MLRSKLIYNILWLLVFPIWSCTPHPQENASYDRKELLFKYLNKHTNLNTQEEFILVLVNSSDCGACDKGRIQAIQTHQLYNSGIDRVFLFSQKKDDLLNEIVDPTAQIIYAKNDLILRKYGLRSFKTFIFHMKNGDIKAWSMLRKGL